MSEDLKKKDAGPDEHRKMVREDDTEGHRKPLGRDDEPEPDGIRRVPKAIDTDDVEGHKK